MSCFMKNIVYKISSGEAKPLVAHGLNEERAGFLFLFVSCFYMFCLSVVNCLFPTVLWVDLKTMAVTFSKLYWKFT